MKIQAYQSDINVVGPCALCGQIVSVNKHETVYRLEGMGGLACAQCAEKNEANLVRSSDTTEEVRLVVKLNNAVAAGPCAICGELTDPARGPELFLEGSWQAVCWPCGNTHAPSLVALLRLSQAAQAYASPTEARVEASR